MEEGAFLYSGPRAKRLGRVRTDGACFTKQGDDSLGFEGGCTERREHRLNSVHPYAGDGPERRHRAPAGHDGRDGTDDGYEAADDWAALVACVVIAYNGVSMSRRAMGDVMDTAVPQRLENEVRALALAVPGAQITLLRGARVRIEALETFSRISVIEGTVRLSCAAAELDIREGQTVKIDAKNGALEFKEK